MIQQTVLEKVVWGVQIISEVGYRMKTIETERLLLREVKLEDAKSMFKNWASDSRVTEFLTWQPYTNVEDVREYISSILTRYKDENHYYHWHIELKEIGEPIGAIGAFHLNEKTMSMSIGYCIGYNWWHKGIMAEAFNAVIQFLFEEVGLNRIEAVHDPDNPNYGRVMQKCGLVYECTSRKSGMSNRGIIDEVHYAILKEDYLKRKSVV